MDIKPYIPEIGHKTGVKSGWLKNKRRFKC